MKKIVWLVVLVGLLSACNPLEKCSVLYTGSDGKTVLECER